MKPSKSNPASKARKAKPLTPPADGKVVLLSGGNPQIAKGDGDAPVQAYIAAMPEWKSAIGKQLDELIVQAVPKVLKAVRWNSPFYGVEGQGYFMSFHAFAKYVKVCFIKGKSLKPLPPVDSKDPHARYLHIREDEAIDIKQLNTWIKQAAAMPGWDPTRK
jgi:hypothetical protein